MSLRGVQMFLKVILKKLNLIYRIVAIIIEGVGIAKIKYFRKLTYK